MDRRNSLADCFEENRKDLLGLAYRMLGSREEAEDAVQETWLRLERADILAVRNLPGWLRTVTSRICLDALRSHGARREERWSGALPPATAAPDGGNPEYEALEAESVGLALLVVLNALSPAERVAFVLHDMFGVPFNEIGEILDRSQVNTKKLASRARQSRRASRRACPAGRWAGPPLRPTASVPFGEVMRTRAGHAVGRADHGQRGSPHGRPARRLR